LGASSGGNFSSFLEALQDFGKEVTQLGHQFLRFPSPQFIHECQPTDAKGIDQFHRRLADAQRGVIEEAHQDRAGLQLLDMETLKPDMILVQRLDCFGTADSNELGYFITLLKKQRVRLITAIDGKDRSKGDLEPTITNAVAACQSRHELVAT
jgi:hypothetical protein